MSVLVFGISYLIPRYQILLFFIFIVDGDFGPSYNPLWD